MWHFIRNKLIGEGETENDKTDDAVDSSVEIEIEHKHVSLKRLPKLPFRYSPGKPWLFISKSPVYAFASLITDLDVCFMQWLATQNLQFEQVPLQDILNDSILDDQSISMETWMNLAGVDYELYNGVGTLPFVDFLNSLEPIDHKDAAETKQLDLVYEHVSEHFHALYMNENTEMCSVKLNHLNYEKLKAFEANHPASSISNGIAVKCFQSPGQPGRWNCYAVIERNKASIEIAHITHKDPPREIFVSQAFLDNPTNYDFYSPEQFTHIREHWVNGIHPKFHRMSRFFREKVSADVLLLICVQLCLLILSLIYL